MVDYRFAAVSSAASGFRIRPADAALAGSSAQARLTSVAVARAKEGDRQAIRFLYVRYSNNVYGYVRSIVGNDDDAEDVTQQVFTKLITRIDRYNERGAPFFAWLIRFARNVAIDHLRANRLIPVDTIIERDACCWRDPDRAPNIKQALATLPAAQREVVVLRHVVGLTPGEIASRMRRTESSINGLHHRARRAVQRELTRLGSAPVTRLSSEPTAA